jgi:cytochrome c biogenesis protein CcmG/thiol:disulfide interchange protein DsbE
VATDLTAEPTPRRRRSRLAALCAAGVAVPLAALIVVLATRAPATTRVADSPLLARRAPAVTAPTLDGPTFRMADLAGQWVLVNFFATWCVPCRQEHPHLVRFDDRHRVIGDAAVVGVIFDDSPDAVRRFRRQEGGSWPMLLDPDGRIGVDFGVAGVPESFLIDPNGVVVAKIVGGVRDDELEGLLARAINRDL